MDTQWDFSADASATLRMPNLPCCACKCRTHGAHTLVTEENLPAIIWLFEVTERDGVEGIKAGGVLCKNVRTSTVSYSCSIWYLYTHARTRHSTSGLGVC